MFDGEAFGQQMVEIVRGYVDAEIAPLIERNATLVTRLAELETRELLLPEKGDDGVGLADAIKDAEGNLVLVMTDGRTKSMGPVDGKDGVGFAEAFDADGVLILRMTDGSELSFPMPKPIGDCPDETCELVAQTLRAIVEMPAAVVPLPTELPQPARQLPVTLNINAGGAAQVPQKTNKSITTRRDAMGNLVADIVETVTD